MSFRPEFFTEGKWYGNGLIFATEREAEANAHQKFISWSCAMDYRATECEGEPNYRYDFVLQKTVPIEK